MGFTHILRAFTAVDIVKIVKMNDMCYRTLLLSGTGGDDADLKPILADRRKI